LVRTALVNKVDNHFLLYTLPKYPTITIQKYYPNVAKKCSFFEVAIQMRSWSIDMCKFHLKQRAQEKTEQDKTSTSIV
jgi:hypothetical protein